jgi:predicted transcriptional regulator
MYTNRAVKPHIFLDICEIVHKVCKRKPGENAVGGFGLKLSEVQRLLGATLIWGEHCLEREVATACGADLMSDVLAFTKDGALLLTGLINPQVVRTADVGGLSAIVFVRGKAPSPEAAAMACELDIPLFSTPHTLFQACGILYANGLAPCPPLAGKSLEE